MNNVVINFISSPCSGKSTMASLLYAELKMMHLNAEYVQEIAKKKIYEKKFDELNNQYNISKEQYDIIKAVSTQVKYTITDSGIMVNLFYNKFYENNICNVEKVEKIFKEKLSEFNNINIFLERNEDHPYQNEGRVHTKDQSKQISKKMEEMLLQYNLPYKKFVSHRDNIKDIINYIFECEKSFKS